MRDGERLATDVFRPARDGQVLDEKLPVLLQRTPYDKTGRSLVERAKYFASHRYVVALQDLRGTYASEGEFTKYIGEGQDGYDAIEYLAKLPYSNGRVGMWGTSYAAHVQANAAKLRPPHLAAIVLNMGGMSNGWDHKIRNHGAFELQQLTWAFRQLHNETKDPIVKKKPRARAGGKVALCAPAEKGPQPSVRRAQFRGLHPHDDEKRRLRRVLAAPRHQLAGALRRDGGHPDGTRVGLVRFLRGRNRFKLRRA